MSMMRFIESAELRRLLALGCFAGIAAGCAGGAFQARPEDIPALEARVAAAPSDAELQARLGAAYFGAGRYEDARRTLTTAVAADPGEEMAHLYLGLTHEKLESWADARASYTTYLESDAAESSKETVRDRLALVARNELRQQARELLEREQQLAQQAPTPNSIAVMPFRAAGLPDELVPLQTALAEMIITDLGFTQLTSVERVRITSMMDEMRLGLGGVTTEETSTRVGRLLRAQHVVQGQLSSSGNQQLAVSASVLNTQNRTAGNPLNEQGELDAIFDIEKQIVFGILREAGYTPSPAERERINENRVANLIAFLAYGRGLDAMDRGNYSEARDFFQQATTSDPNFGAARTQQSQASQLSSASNTTTEQVAQTASAPPPAPVTMTVLQNVVNTVNPSPAPVIATQNPPTTTQTSQTGQGERTGTTGEGSGQSGVGQAAKTIITITIPNPTRSGGGQ